MLKRGRSATLDTATYTVYVCPACGQQIMESEYDPAKGRIWGHYHDPPDGWEGPEDPWFDAAAVGVVTIDNLNERVRAAYDAGKEDAG